jgi:hypothetical protein
MACCDFLKSFKVGGQMKKQFIVFADGKVFGNGNDDGYIFMNHTLKNHKFQKPNFK